MTDTREAGLREAAEIARSFAELMRKMASITKEGFPVGPEDAKYLAGFRAAEDIETRILATAPAPAPPQSGEREVEAVALARASLVEMMEEGPNLRVKGNRHDRARAAIAALDALRVRAGES